jgi:curved DNA-binding protein CbpA
MDKLNPYEVLGVARDATDQQIRDAYRPLIHRAHPDRNGGDRSRYDGLNLCYRVLLDVAARKHYDETGELAEPVVDHSRARMATLLAGMMDGAIGSLLQSGRRPEAENIVAIMRLGMQRGAKAIAEAIESQTIAVAVYETIAGRFVCIVPGADNVLGEVAKQQLQSARQTLDGLKIAEAEQLSAIDLMDQFNFDVVPVYTK